MSSLFRGLQFLQRKSTQQSRAVSDLKTFGFRRKTKTERVRKLGGPVGTRRFYRRIMQPDAHWQGDRSTGVWNSDEHTADDAFRGRQPNQWHKYRRILSNLLRWSQYHTLNMNWTDTVTQPLSPSVQSKVNPALRSITGNWGERQCFGKRPIFGCVPTAGVALAWAQTAFPNDSRTTGLPGLRGCGRGHDYEEFRRGAKVAEQEEIWRM